MHRVLQASHEELLIRRARRERNTMTGMLFVQVTLFITCRARSEPAIECQHALIFVASPF